MEEFFTAISNFGFPVVVAGYLLFRIESKMERFSDTMQRNTESNINLVNAINKLSDEVREGLRNRK